MRTIKFRGKHLCGQWYYGNLIIRETDSPVPETPCSYKCVLIGDVEDGSEEEVEENTVGQFTGLTDKNGKEIYEGDFVKTKGGLGGVVLWNSRGYFYIKDDNYFDDEEPDLSPLGSLLCCKRKRLEIIGNIHDNPELMKEGEK